MGRDWSWLSGGKKKSSTSSKSKKEDIKSTVPSPPARLAGNTETAAGCMSAVFNIFDFHQLQFPINHHHLHLPKGVDAPRNSLESMEETEEAPSSPTRKDGNLNISMGIRIKTKPQGRSSSSSESHMATETHSPSIKTPTLVARLMGLDLVPDNYRSSSPTLSSSILVDLKTPPTRSSHTKNKHRHYSLQRNSVDGGTRSLPETPRISLGRRSVDVYEHQRSSFHLRRDNNINVLSERESGIGNVKIARIKEMKIHEDKENRSPREYARQIVMQLKENVSRRRRMGTDITNKEQQPRESHDSKKASSKISSITYDSSSASSSPRVGSREVPKTKPNSLQTNNVSSRILEKVQDKTRLQTVQEEPRGPDLEKQRKSTKKCKKPENFKSRLVKPPQTMKEEPFVRSSTTSNNSKNNNALLLIQGDKSSCKKTPLSINDLISFTSVPTIKKKGSSPHYKSSNVKLRETQTPRNRASSSSEFPSFPSQSQPHIAANAGEELEYITRILRRTGIDRDTPISYAKWFSSSHPLDPSIFYFLEHFAVTSTRPRNSPQNLALRCNRKLLFHLVDEILADILKPHINSKPWVCHYPIQSQQNNLKGSELIDELSRRIEQFPLAKCLVLEDIDALVAGDFPDIESAFEEDGEGIVTEIERRIFDTLVTETTADFYATWNNKTAAYRRNDDVSGTWGVHVTRYPSNAMSHHDSSSTLPRG